MSKQFEDRAALVTGAGSGIGRAIARQLAAEGASVVVSDIDEPGGAETVRAIQAGRAVFVRADASRAEDSEALAAAAVAEFGGLHIAVNNAGIGGPTAPAMLEFGGGSIVNVASILGQVGFRNSSAYVAAKHGVVGLTRTAALE